MQPLRLGNRPVGPEFPPLVVAEIGINHEGSFEKAVKMVDDAHQAGCECVKFQSHVIADEMIPNDVVPGNADTSIWEIMERCALTEDEEFRLKEYVERKNMIFLSTPFSRSAVDRLHGMDVVAFKIGSGECNNYPLVKHIAGFGKPIILSTGMNDLESIRIAVHILREADIGFALLHCTSMYPTPYDKVRLGALTELSHTFPGVPVGLSDHSVGNYTCFAAVALGASILEKHFTSDKSWPGPDIPISIDPSELRELVHGSKVIHEAGGGSKDILPEEEPTIRFAHACVVSIRNIKKGDAFSMDNIWVKRPGTGEIKASHFETLLGRVATKDIGADVQIKRSDFK